MLKAVKKHTFVPGKLSVDFSRAYVRELMSFVYAEQEELYHSS